MRRHRLAWLPASGILAALLLPCAAAPALAEVSVNINIGPPAVVVHEPPEVIVIPHTMVYYAPAVEVDLLFHNGYWWTSHEGRWFRSRAYKGPWVVVGPRYVPVEIVRLPRDYRTVYVREQRVPYGQLKKHWKHRELERRERRGEWKDWKEEKRERGKERKEEWKEEKRER
ncbi:MAG: hypothetical protein HZA60_03250, partial [Deltaproteobacteria bacterium]|nr:hypothetical protein [Deltaproteobacteria bacterium]